VLSRTNFALIRFSDRTSHSLAYVIPLGCLSHRMGTQSYVELCPILSYVLVQLLCLSENGILLKDTADGVSTSYSCGVHREASNASSPLKLTLSVRIWRLIFPANTAECSRYR
jgi:hypothetical protein